MGYNGYFNEIYNAAPNPHHIPTNSSESYEPLKQYTLF